MLLLLVFSLLFAKDVYYPSGLIKNFEIDFPQKTTRTDEKTAVQDFYKKYLKPHSINITESKRFSDKTHRHINYDYFFQDRKVIGYGLKIHFNQKGYVEYADSTLKHKLDYIQNEKNPQFLAQFKKVYPSFIISEKTPVIWISENGEQAFYAYEIHCHTTEIPRKIRHWVIKEDNLQILEEFKVFRFAARDIYLASPLGTHPALAQQTLNNLLSANQLQSNQFNVQREENTASPTLSDVDYTTNFSAAFDTDPANYTHTCIGTPAQCPNQGFEAVNAYYHLDTFRSQLDTYLTNMGNTVTFSNDPLRVIINSLSVDFDGNGTGTDDVNNAAFVSSGCRPGVFNQCIVFLRPAAYTGASIASFCSTPSPVQFYQLAREALVIVHEYQHYITHTITGMVGGGSSYNVGDALHEGYSDYFGASQTTNVAGMNVATVGQYSFQNCTPLMRDVSVLRVYQNTSSDTNYTAGLSWASGLWNLRTLYGQTIADMIALKSLFFLSTRPGFVEAVEALVKADKALYNGSHVSKIRTLFYEDIKIVGGKSGIFKDTNNKIVEMGLRSCIGVSATRNPSSLFSLLSFLLIVLLASKCIRKK